MQAFEKIHLEDYRRAYIRLAVRIRFQTCAKRRASLKSNQCTRAEARGRAGIKGVLSLDFTVLWRNNYLHRVVVDPR